MITSLERKGLMIDIVELGDKLSEILRKKEVMGREMKGKYH